MHETLGTNVAYERTFSFGEVDRAFADADRTVQAELYWPRSTGMPMDTNGAIGDYDRGTGVVTIYANSMNFTYFLWLYRGVAEDPGRASCGSCPSPPAAASARSSSCTRCRLRRVPRRCSPAAR